MSPTEMTRFWRPPSLDGTELIFTSCRRHAFPRHFHQEYTIAIMVRGVERLRLERGGELAPRGSLILINPGQVHDVRSFCDQFGLPPCQYQIHRRVLHALNRLRQGMPISRAAYESGFVDQSHLNRHFKRIMGVTPGQFRANRKTVQDG